MAIKVLIPAAGKGTRAGLGYPKTLFVLDGKSILARILEVTKPYDSEPVLVVGTDGHDLIEQHLIAEGLRASLVMQPKPLGMGDAVLKFAQADSGDSAEHIILIWGDIPYVQPQTLAKLVDAHLSRGMDFSFVTRNVDRAYTRVVRDNAGNVQRLIESRERGQSLEPGERDIGLFMFRKDLVLALLSEDLPNKTGAVTGEHGFLYLVEHLVLGGHKVLGLPVAEEIELKSLNYMSDL